jgi:DNA-binding PadR family transcriptional regulator
VSDVESAPTPTHDREAVNPQTLTLFQQNILLVLAESDGADYGLGVKRSLEDLYGEDVKHGRLYPNLDQLVERGLVQKGERDGRTNDYALTAAGRKTLQADASRRGSIVTRLEGRQP